jgi:crossover junction endodeoxyribonuclease RusA
MQVILPWPPKELSPNKRIHWAQKSKIAKQYRHACHMLTKQSGIAVDWDGDIHMAITFYPPDRRRRDDDNAIASFKAGRDGMADALGVDDKRFRTHPWIADEIGGYVKITISREYEAKKCPSS